MDQDDRIGNLPTDQYWAAVETARLPDVVRAKALEYRRRLEFDGRIDLYQRATRCFYGLDPDGGFKNSAAVTFGGPDGEMTMFRVNHFHSIAQGILTTVTRQRPSFDGHALSTDSEALGQAQLGSGIVEGYFRERGLEALEREAARMAWVLSEGWTALRWNPFIGRQIGVTQRPALNGDGTPKTQIVEQDLGDGLPLHQTEAPVMEDWPEREGDVEAQTFAPQEVIRNLDATSRDLDWVILPYRENVWDLAARYPQFRDQIIAQRMSRRWARTAMVAAVWETPRFNDDQVTVWYVYHVPTSACPNGRHAQIVGDVVLADVEWRAEVPCWGMIPEVEMTSGSGYSLAFDMLALCTAYDAVWDIVYSSHDALGMQNIAAPKNADVTSEIIGRGLRLFGFTPQPGVEGGGKPTPMQLLAISADSFKLLEMMPHIMETLSGLNAVARGEPPPQLKSGTALALVQSLSVAFNSGFQAEYVRHMERVATGLLRMLQRHAIGNKRIAEVAGRSQQAVMRQWAADSISQVSRISVEIAAPFMQSEAGRYQFAQDLAQNKMITTPQEFVEAVEAGTVTPMLEAPTAKVRQLRSENEMFLAGEKVEIGKYDDHVPHVREHYALLTSEVRARNPQMVEAVLMHCDRHIAIWYKMPPEVAIATGQSVMPPPPPPPLPLGPPPPHAGAPPPHPPAHPVHGAPQKAQPLGHDGGPHMPSMPHPPPGAPPTPGVA